MILFINDDDDDDDAAAAARSSAATPNTAINKHVSNVYFKCDTIPAPNNDFVGVLSL